MLVLSSMRISAPLVNNRSAMRLAEIVDIRPNRPPPFPAKSGEHVCKPAGNRPGHILPEFTSTKFALNCS